MLASGNPVFRFSKDRIPYSEDAPNRFLDQMPIFAWAQLEEPVRAYHQAVKDLSWEDAPLGWTTSTGDQGGAMMLLAERKKDLIMARTALRQIEAAFEVTRAGGQAPGAVDYEGRPQDARALVDRLKAH